MMRVKLKDITNYSKGSQINGDCLRENGEYIYLNGGIGPSGNWDTYNVLGNTVTVSEGGNSSGYINYITEPFWCGAHCYYLFNGPKNTKYLYYALKSQQQRLFKLRSGACMPNIKKKDLGDFEFEFDFNEEIQNNIVNVLDRCNKIIKNYKLELKMLDILIKARFVEMFGDPILNEKGWNKNSLSNIIEKANNGLARRGNDENGEIVLRLVELQNGFIDYSNPNKILLSEKEKNKYLLKENDLLFARVNGNPNNVGRCAVFHEIDNSVYHNDHIIRVHFKEEIVNGTFLSHLLNKSFGKKQMKKQIKTSAGQYTISQDGIGAIIVIIPPIKLQNEFEDFVRQVDKSKFEVQKSLEKTQQLYDSLMQKYFG